MFAKGGAAFPDLSGDGNVTQKDILIGRGVIPMQEGGMAPMPAPAAPGPQMMPPGLPPIDPNSVDINQAAQGAMQQGIDPAMLEGMLTQYASGLEDLENAEDYETVINGIRGDDRPIEQRYEELAGVVGPEDARATPESVLTLVQPVMQIAAVDQGIGGLAAEEMNAPIEGAMAEGIMSTVNMGGPDQAQGGPAPVNFNQGGAVQYFAPENANRVAMPNSRMQTLFDEQMALAGQIYDPASREEDLQSQRDMTKAGILFDIAQGALSFAGGAGRPGATPAEQLATAFTPVVGNIGARAGELNKFQMAQKAEDKRMQLGALQQASAAYQSELTRKAAAANVKPGDTFVMKDAEGKVLYQGPIGTIGQQNALLEKYPTAVTVTEVAAPKAPDFTTFINPNDETDFFSFNKNDLSESNQNAIETVRSATNPDGTTKYRETGLYTPSKDSATGASRQNFVNRQTGESEMVDLATPEGRTRAQQLEDAGYLKAGVADLDSASVTAKIQVVINKNDPNDIQSFDLSDPAQRKKYNALDKTIYIPTSTPSMKDLTEGVSLGNGAEAKFIELTSNPEVLEQYANGTLDAFSTNTINAFITQETMQKRVIDPETGRATLVPGFKLSPALESAIQQRSQVQGITLADMPLLNGKDVLNTANAELDEDPNTTGRIKFKADGTIDYSAFADDPTVLITGVDLTKSQTWRSGVNRFFNQIAGQLKIGDGYAGEGGRITSQADTQLNSLAKKIVTTGRAGVDGKVFAYDLEMLKDEVDRFRPGFAKTDVQARDQLVAVRNSLASMYMQAYKTASDPAADPTGKTITKAGNIISELETLIGETTAAIAVYDKYLGGDPIADAVSDRAATSSVTGSLSRASDEDEDK